VAEKCHTLQGVKRAIVVRPWWRRWRRSVLYIAP
jgi:hypothetical protein